jgi:lipopolysaccharide assembly outer membrane protein LptD (OstA)
MSVERWFQARHLERCAAARLAGITLAAIWWTTIAFGAADPESPVEAVPQHPVHIQSERLEAEMDADTVDFSGAVRVDGDGYTITADRLTIQFQQGSIDRNRLAGTVSAKEISRMTARGRVRIQADTLTADAEQAVYEPDTGRVWLDPAPAAEVSPAGGRAAAPRGPSVQAPGRPPAMRVRVTLLPGAGQ